MKQELGKLYNIAQPEWNMTIEELELTIEALRLASISLKLVAGRDVCELDVKTLKDLADGFEGRLNEIKTRL